MSDPFLVRGRRGWVSDGGRERGDKGTWRQGTHATREGNTIEVTWGHGGHHCGGELARGHVGKGRGIRTERYRGAKIQGDTDKCRGSEAGIQNAEPKIQGGVGPSGI